MEEGRPLRWEEGRIKVEVGRAKVAGRRSEGKGQDIVNREK
jgi:hypothetical protein